MSKPLCNCFPLWLAPFAAHLPVVAFLAKLLLKVTQGEAVGLHHAAVGNLLATEEVGDHQLFRPGSTVKHMLNSRVR